MKNLNKNFLSRRNKRGVFIFVGIALILVYIPRIIMNAFPSKDFKVSEELIDELDDNQKKQEHSYLHQSKRLSRKKYKRPNSKFDPNQYSKEQWMTLGLSSKQADVVLNFTKRGIYNNEQLERIFVIPEELFMLIKDSTYYPQKQYTGQPFSSAEKPLNKKLVKVEINSADQETLETIPGIGPFYARNIIKYRERLGGFVNKGQLLEVWKMDIEKYNSIENNVVIDLNDIKKIALNSASAEEIKSHPYMNWNIANSIVKIREKRNGYSKIEEIKESVLIDEELFEKIKPYLSL